MQAPAERRGLVVFFSESYAEKRPDFSRPLSAKCNRKAQRSKAKGQSASEDPYENLLREISIRAMNHIASAPRIPAASPFNFRPLYHRTPVVNTRQAGATIERIGADARDTRRNCNTRQLTTTIKRRNTDARDAIRNDNVLQSSAIPEHTITHTRDTFRNDKTCQAVTSIKRTTSNTRDTLRDDTVSAT